MKYIKNFNEDFNTGEYKPEFFDLISSAHDRVSKDMKYVKHKTNSNVFGIYYPSINQFHQYTYQNPNPLTKKEKNQGHRDKPAVVCELNIKPRDVDENFLDHFDVITYFEFVGLDGMAFNKC